MAKKEAAAKKTTPQKSASKKVAKFPVEELAEKQGLKPWYLAGLRRAAKWAPGKQVSEAEFEKSVKKFNERPQGGGKI